MKIFAAFIVICAIAGATCKVYNSESGDVSSEDGNFLNIRVPKDKKIAFEINTFDLGPGDFLKFHDGRKGRRFVLKKVGGSIIKTPESDSYMRETVHLPIKIVTTTRKLFLETRGIQPYYDGFRGHYTSFTEHGSCFKDELDSGELITCDTDRISPVATRCDVTMNCDSNYTQYSTTKTCMDEAWEGEVDCRPRSDLVENCQFDVDELGTEEVCPFSVDEVLNYYKDFEDIEDAYEQSVPGLGRSSRGRKQMRCNRVCQRRGGRFVLGCNRRRGLAFYWKCLKCRMIHRCRSPVVYI